MVSAYSSFIVPGQQLINPVDFMVSDMGEDICQPGLGIDVVEFGGFHEGEDDGCGFAAALGAHEHVVFAANGDSAHGTLGCVVIQF
jgi:hypothetical protein